MRRFRIRRSADEQLDGIARFTREHWGQEQAARYIEELFAEFQRIADRVVPWTPMPADFEITGYRRRWRRHIIYWRDDADAVVAIVAVLHERMDQISRLRTSVSVRDD